MSSRKRTEFRRLIKYWLEVYLPENSVFGQIGMLEYKNLKKFIEAQSRFQKSFEELDADSYRSIMTMLFYRHRRQVSDNRHYQKVEAQLSENIQYFQDLNHDIKIWLEQIRPIRGLKPNLTGQMIIADLAAIFHWATNIVASRRVDRITLSEVGPFREFAKIVWPLVTANGKDGFEGAYRAWSENKIKFGLASPVVANFLAHKK